MVFVYFIFEFLRCFRSRDEVDVVSGREGFVVVVVGGWWECTEGVVE